ncbi:MAG TPA: collagen-like protein [Conexibacter sp.]|jgi:hypothetical protein|nr:collagen-like protein [Conexibacter sp.]
MHRLRRPRLTYANVVASLALFVALGGTGYAATQLAPNSVGTPQLKRGAVTGAKIAARTRRALRGKTGPSGQRGPEGARGPAGANGANGMNGQSGTDGAVSAKIGYVLGPIPVPFNKPSFPIIAVPVPRPGSYVVLAKLTVTPSGTEEIVCALGADGGSIGGFDVAAVRGDNIEQTIALTYAGTFEAPLVNGHTFLVTCSTTAATRVGVKQAKITLIQASDVSVALADGT